MTNATKMIILILVFFAGAIAGIKLIKHFEKPIPPAIAQNQGVAVSCTEIETTKPDGTKTREIKFSAVASQAQSITPPAPNFSAPPTFRVSFIPNYNFESSAINYGFLVEKRITGELFAGIYANLNKFYQLQSAGGSLSYGF
jgi:hypothetical protein